MEYPELPNGFIWRISKQGAEIWEKLPDYGPFNNDYGICSESTTDTRYYNYDTVDVTPGHLHHLMRVGRITKYVNRKRQVYSEAVDWTQDAKPFDQLQRVALNWARTNRVTYGFQEGV